VLWQAIQQADLAQMYSGSQGPVIPIMASDDVFSSAADGLLGSHQVPSGAAISGGCDTLQVSY
jgi:hypothetical protein